MYILSLTLTIECKNEKQSSGPIELSLEADFKTNCNSLL